MARLLGKQRPSGAQGAPGPPGWVLGLGLPPGILDGGGGGRDRTRGSRPHSEWLDVPGALTDNKEVKEGDTGSLEKSEPGRGTASAKAHSGNEHGAAKNTHRGSQDSSSPAKTLEVQCGGSA